MPISAGSRQGEAETRDRGRVRRKKGSEIRDQRSGKANGNGCWRSEAGSSFVGVETGNEARPSRLESRPYQHPGSAFSCHSREACPCVGRERGAGIQRLFIARKLPYTGAVGAQYSEPFLLRGRRICFSCDYHMKSEKQILRRAQDDNYFHATRITFWETT
jgi:hypothetical protein